MPASTVLSEVTIGDLFQKDPTEITDDEFNAIISHYRENRKALVEADSAQKRAPSTKRAAKVKVDLNIDDLDLEL